MHRRLALLLVSTAVAVAQPPSRLAIDLSAAAPLAATPRPEFSATSPQGLAVGATDRYLTFGGKPWYPVAAEFAFARTFAGDWPAELAKFKAARIGVIVAPVVWIYHEGRPGHFDWSGDRDIAAFARACAGQGLPCILRLAVGAEPLVRNGGLPDWAAGQDGPRILQAFPAFCAALAGQLKGLLWQEGGPVLGLELEYGPALPRGAASALRAIAQTAGLDLPYYFTASEAHAPGFLDLATSVPEDSGFLSGEDPVPQAEASYLFRASPALGTVLTTGLVPSYRRRPSLSGADAAAAVLVAMGSGCNLPIYRPFHGGSNPADASGPLNETRRAGSPADLPLFNQDSLLPISASGALRPAYHALRALDLFAADFGAALAPLATWLPLQVATAGRNQAAVRWAVRSNGDQGFLFINNLRRSDPLPDRRAIQFELRYRDHTQVLPFSPMTLLTQTAAVWPLNLWMGGVKLVYAAAQPVCRVGSWFVFMETPGVPGDFLFDPATLAPGSAAHYGNLRAGLDSTFTVAAANGVEVHVLYLRSDQAALAWKFRLAGKDRLVLAEAVVATADGLRATLTHGAPGLIAVLPAVGFNRPTQTKGLFSSVEVPAGKPRVRLSESDTNPLRVPPVALDAAGVVIPPVAADYDSGQQVKVTVPIDFMDPGSRPELILAYTGDTARAYVDGKLISDSFMDGSEWRIPVTPHLPGIVDHGLTVKIVPYRTASPIYVTPANAPWFGSENPVFPVRIRASVEETQTVDLVAQPLDK